MKKINIHLLNLILYGAIKYEKVIGYKLYKKDNGVIDAIKFNNFYNKFIKDKYYLLISDNANFYRSKIVKENIQNSNNKIIYSLPYNPTCNLIKNNCPDNFDKLKRKTY